MEESHPGLIDCEQNANGEMIDMRKGVFPFAKIPCDFYKILSRIHIESFLQNNFTPEKERIRSTRKG